MNIARFKPALLAAALLLGGAAMAANDKNTVSDGPDQRLMLRDKDPVSYFTQPEPVAGNRDIKADYDGNGIAYAIGGSYGELAAEYEAYLAR